MRSKSVLALIVSVLSLGVVAPVDAQAFGWHRDRPPAGWGRVQRVRHWVYYPRYQNVYRTHRVTDPYAYRYKRPRYYPYYNSGYWKSARVMRKRRRAHFRYPRYYRSWGYHKPGYRAISRRALRHRRHW